MKLRDKQILQIALPSIVSNITVPLLGLIDVAIVGHLGSPAYIGAIAVGGMLFNIIYWIFGFLRMGTSGMTSQAYGKRDLPEVVRLLVRSVGIGLAVASCLIALQVLIRQGAFLLIHPTDEVKEMVRFISTSASGVHPPCWDYTGSRDGSSACRIHAFPHVSIAITQNIVNIIASLCLVYLCGMKVEGVALGTLIAQYAGFLMGLMLWIRNYGKLQRYWEIKNYKLEIKGEERKGIWEKETMLKFFQVNRTFFFAHPLPGGGYSVLYFSRSFAGRNHFGCQHAVDAALHFVLVCNGWFCLRRRGPERQIHRRTQPGSLYRHRCPTSLWMGSGNGSSLYVDLCTGR